MRPDSTRPPTGAPLLQTRTTEAIRQAVLDDLATHGYGRLTMEGVARRAGVGKSAIYRRWSTKQDMVIALVCDVTDPLTSVPDTGTLREDLRAALLMSLDWLNDPRMRRILPDLTAEAVRNPTFSRAYQKSIAVPRQTLAAIPFHRAIARREIPADTDIVRTLDMISAPIYWQLSLRQSPVDDAFIEAVIDQVLRDPFQTTSGSGRR